MALWEAHGDRPMGIPWDAIETCMWNGMECVYVWLMRINQWASHGMPMGPLIGGFNGMALWVAHGA